MNLKMRISTQLKCFPVGYFQLAFLQVWRNDVWTDSKGDQKEYAIANFG